MDTRAKKRKRKSKNQDVNYLVYAVSKGKPTGIFKNWLTYSQYVIGCKGSTYKGFNSLDAVRLYLIESGTTVTYNDCTTDDFDGPVNSTDTETVTVASNSCDSISSLEKCEEHNASMEEITKVCNKSVIDTSCAY